MTTRRLPAERGCSLSSAGALTALAAHPGEAARCQHCGEPIAPTRRIDARYCDASCRSAARHARTALGTQPREAARQDPASVERRQSRACAPRAHSAAYVPPPEWAWVAAYYASHCATGSAK